MKEDFIRISTSISQLC